MGTKLVVITGASSGIGKETALYLARRGYHVIACVRKPRDGEKLLREAADNLETFILDVNHPEHIDQLQRHVGKWFGQDSTVSFFGLINNAAVSPVAPIEVVSTEELDFIFKTNVYGVVHMIQAMLPYLKYCAGRIVNISSGAGVMAIPLSGAYSMSKFAVEALSDVLRVELKQFGIKVAVVEPGLIRTCIHEKNTDSMERIIGGLSTLQKEAYEGPLRTYVETQSKQAASATPAIDVSKTITLALEARRPKTRYGAGTDARFLRMVHCLLNDRIRDRITSRIGAW